MDKIKAHFQEKIAGQVKEIKDFLAAHGDEKVGDINVSQVYGGMRGMLALICETSKLDPDEGIRFRGYSIPELQEKLPKKDDGSLSWAAIRNNVRYVNIETRLGWLSQQKKMLNFIEENL